MNSTLYIFSGLPASGKSTLARLLASKINAMYIRIDTVEQALKDLCNFNVEGEGYRLSYRMVQDNLNLGINCISDSCNPIELTRNEWKEIAKATGANYVNIEVSCSDIVEHEFRVTKRNSDIVNLKQPSWEQVRNRHYEPWEEEVIRIDTAGQTIDASFSELLMKLSL